MILSVNNLTKSVEHRTLFESIKFGVEDGERIGLIGPNGSGKSTLLKILAGRTDFDSGTVAPQRGLRIGFLEQVPKLEKNQTIEECVFEAVPDISDWQASARAHEIIARLSLGDTTRHVGTLSGGWQKRVALARELARDPDLLLLDEPTNHLDIEGVLWLEDLLARSRFASITITHDRAFLEKVSTRILELDRRNPQGLLNIKGSYSDYLEAKTLLMTSQELEEQKRRNTLRRETEWLRRGAKARQTKQTARINAAAELKKEVEELSQRNLKNFLDIEFQAAERKPKKLIEAVDISKSYNGHLVIPKMSVLLTPKTRIGLLGPNGCGKSTLIKLLIGREKPDSGSVKFADALEVAYFEQNRESLDPKKTLIKNICPYGEFVDFAGKKLHVRSYLSKFLFNPQQAEQFVEKLSGGEQSRLRLAQLMLTRANVLVLDEPTNDLDMATLDVLKDVLAEFDGAIILVSHDRYFLDQVSKLIYAFDEDPATKEKQIIAFASISQWQDWHENRDYLRERGEMGGGTSISGGSDPGEARGNSKSKKNPMKLKKDLDRVSQAIETLEAEIARLTQESQRPDVVSNAKRLTDIMSDLAATQSKLDQAYAELETLV